MKASGSAQSAAAETAAAEAAEAGHGRRIRRCFEWHCDALP